MNLNEIYSFCYAITTYQYECVRTQKTFDLILLHRADIISARTKIKLVQMLLTELPKKAFLLKFYFSNEKQNMRTDGTTTPSVYALYNSY
jgi:hypothetical protein